MQTKVTAMHAHRHAPKAVGVLCAVQVDTHIHHSACMHQKHLLRFIKSKLRKESDEVVIFRDGKYLTLAEVREGGNWEEGDMGEGAGEEEGRVGMGRRQEGGAEVVLAKMGKGLWRVQGRATSPLTGAGRGVHEAYSA